MNLWLGRGAPFGSKNSHLLISNQALDLDLNLKVHPTGLGTKYIFPKQGLDLVLNPYVQITGLGSKCFSNEFSSNILGQNKKGAFQYFCIWSFLCPWEEGLLFDLFIKIKVAALIPMGKAVLRQLPSQD